MSDSLPPVRWRHVLGAAAAVVVATFLILIVIVTVYAFVLSFQARGAPDQQAIRLFARRISPRLMPWLEMLMTLVIAFIVARKETAGGVTQGLFIGVLAGLLSLAVRLAFGRHPGVRDLFFLLVVAGLGCMGGFVARQWAGRARG